MSFCSAVLFLLFISYIARIFGSLLQLCFIAGGLIPMLQVWFFLSSGLFFELVLHYLAHLQMITVTRKAITSRVKSLTSLLFIIAKLCNQTVLWNSYLYKRKWTFFLLIKCCWLWQPSQMLNVLSQAIWHTLLPPSRKVDACQQHPSWYILLMIPSRKVGIILLFIVS